ncbi:hypothetical protein SEA_CLUBPENGUIN_83 [Streptomyces phage ClubPenguin]|nr:hypothetical protein SEA_CLUBPENGUIN_83 [Streptomyces phage ClubPenguin]
MRHDMTAYFDAVLDERMRPLCNGTQEEVLAWLESRPQFEDDVVVCIGKTMQMVTVEEYLEQFG